MHGELCRDMTKFTAVFYTTHNAPSAPPGPLQEEITLQYTENAETCIKQERKPSSKVGSAASAKPHTSCY